MLLTITKLSHNMQIKTKCANCGKTIAPARAGSLTAWLFRQAECSCEAAPKQDQTVGQTNSLASLALQSDVSSEGFAHKKGELIGESYEVIEALGRGGMGEVYSVFDRLSETVYALKIISPGLGEQKIMAKRLEHEAEAAKSLTHANIVSIYDVGRDKGGAPFLIMDYIIGENLEQLLQKEVILQSQRAIELFTQVAEALVHAHSKGLVHRDLKPSNILLSKADPNHELVKLVDFGIAKLTDSFSADKTKLTQTGELIGSPLYMSPEQCRGDELDGRSDIYSFGCIMYEAVSGKPPFSGDNPVRILLKHASEPAPRLSNNVRISQSFKAVIERCLEKAPENRYPTAGALLADLRKVSDGKQLAWNRRLRLATHKRRRVLAISAIAALLMTGSYFAYSRFDFRPRNAERDAHERKEASFETIPFRIHKAEWETSSLRERATVLLAKALEKRHWTAAEAADYLGGDAKSIADLMDGNPGYFSLEQLNQFLLVLGIHPSFPENPSTEEKQNSVALYTKAIKENPKKARGYWKRASAYEQLKLWDQAIADLSVAIALEPEEDGPLSNRSMDYLSAGKYDLALKDSDELMRRFPKENNYQNRALIHYAMKQFNEALSDNNNAIKHLDIPRPGPYSNRAMVYEALGRYDEALADWKKAKEIDPTYYHADEQVEQLMKQLKLAKHMSANPGKP